MELHLTATKCHLPRGISQCYLPPDTSEWISVTVTVCCLKSVFSLLRKVDRQCCKRQSGVSSRH